MSAVRYAFEGGAATITLASPGTGNALSDQMGQGLAAGVAQAQADDARVVVLRAEGPAFSFGGDVATFAAAQDRGDFVGRAADGVASLVATLAGMDAVVVSVVQGVAAGFGVALAAAADIVLAAESATFVLAYSMIGFTMDGGASMLPASIGLHRALNLSLLNPLLSAADARAHGPRGAGPPGRAARRRCGAGRAAAPRRVADRPGRCQAAPAGACQPGPARADGARGGNHAGGGPEPGRARGRRRVPGEAAGGVPERAAPRRGLTADGCESWHMEWLLHDQSLVGRTGTVIEAIRGGEHPGEVRVVVEGLPHHYLAYCSHPVPEGAYVLVINSRGARQVDVEPWEHAEIDLGPLGPGRS